MGFYSKTGIIWSVLLLPNEPHVDLMASPTVKSAFTATEFLPFLALNDTLQEG